MTQLNCGHLILEKSIKPRGTLCFRPDRLTSKVPGDETEAQNPVVKKKTVFFVVKTRFCQTFYFYVSELLALDCHLRCLNSGAFGPRRSDSRGPYLENLLAHRGKQFWLSCNFPCHACPSLRTCVPLPLTQINKL